MITPALPRVILRVSDPSSVAESTETTSKHVEKNAQPSVEKSAEMEATIDDQEEAIWNEAADGWEWGDADGDWQQESEDFRKQVEELAAGNKRFHRFHLVRRSSQELLSEVILCQHILDLPRTSIDIVADRSNRSSFWVPEPAPCTKLSAFDSMVVRATAKFQAAH